jgi:hypothetical protein
MPISNITRQEDFFKPINSVSYSPIILEAINVVFKQRSTSSNLYTFAQVWKDWFCNSESSSSLCS